MIIDRQTRARGYIDLCTAYAFVFVAAAFVVHCLTQSPVVACASLLAGASCIVVAVHELRARRN